MNHVILTAVNPFRISICIFDDRNYRYVDRGVVGVENSCVRGRVYLEVQLLQCIDTLLAFLHCSWVVVVFVSFCISFMIYFHVANFFEGCSLTWVCDSVDAFLVNRNIFFADIKLEIVVKFQIRK